MPGLVNSESATGKKITFATVVLAMSEACQEMSRATRSRPTSISARRSEVDQEQRRRLSVVKGDVSEEMDEGSQRDILMHLLSGVSSEPELICGETSEASDENEDEEGICYLILCVSKISLGHMYKFKVTAKAEN